MTKKQLIRRSATFIILALTVIGAVYYLVKHRSLLTQLGHISPWVIVAVFLLYVVLFVVLMLILDATLKLCRIKLGKQENILINAYTLIINNFFIIGQNGPIFRGYYLKTRHNLKVRNYAAVTLLYFLIYGIISVFFISLGSQAWWLTTLLGIVMVGMAVGLIKLYVRRKKFKAQELSVTPKGLVYLMVVTALQVIVQTIIYGVELHNSGHIRVNVSQIITYSGTANLALFVALTPGAIGIRESFLILSERLNHVTSGMIVVANVIDRSVYLAFLLVLLVITLSIHAKDKLTVKPPAETDPKDKG